MSQTDLGTYEMLWDCAFCGTRKLLGKTHRHCPSCGAEQDPSRRYFPSDEEKVAVENHEYQGADRQCGYCKAPNAAKAKHCTACGAPLDDAKGVATRAAQAVADGAAFAGETLKDAQGEAQAARAARAGQAGAAAAPAAPGKKGGALKWVLLVVGLVVAAIIVMVVWKKPAAARVTGHSWEREVKIERFGPTRTEAWCDELPFGARDVSRHREKRSEKEIPDGETCRKVRKDNGDGTFKMVKECEPKTRKEPVYDDKCSYLVDRWSYERSLSASGQGVRDEPRWPEVRLRTGQCIGCEREAGREERYLVHFTREDDGKAHRCDVDRARWAALADGARVKVDFAVVTGGPKCDSLRPGP